MNSTRLSTWFRRVTLTTRLNLLPGLLMVTLANWVTNMQNEPTEQPKQTRIVRVDELNYAVQTLETVTPRDKTQHPHQEWQYSGYYGHRLDWAALSAIHRGLPVGGTVTADAVDAAVKRIVNETKQVMR